jgi:hypothetical protein
MLDGQRYFGEFPDEEPDEPRRLLLSEELLVSLAAIEREISAFIRAAGGETADKIGANANGKPSKD